MSQPDLDSLLEGVPPATDADVKAMIQRGRPYTVVFLKRGPAPIQDEVEEQRAQGAHLRHLARLRAAGKIIFNGPVLVDHEIRGISIYATSAEEAAALAGADPKVRAGQLAVEILPWFGVLDVERA